MKKYADIVERLGKLERREEELAREIRTLKSRLDTLPPPPAHAIYSKSIRCGKKACKKCPHGPYYYSSYREDGSVKTIYWGREQPKFSYATLSAKADRSAMQRQLVLLEKEHKLLERAVDTVRRALRI